MKSHPESRRAWRYCRYVSVAVGLAAAPAAGYATSADWQAGAQTVLELLQAEARPAPVLPLPVATPAATMPSLQLTALYGTAGRLTAIVEVNGVRKEYRPGASLPFGGAGAAGEYRLVRIVDSCVVLRRGERGRLRTACYRPGPPSSPPVASPVVPTSVDVLAGPLPQAARLP